MYSVVNGKPLEQWKVTELKEELKKRGLPVRGLKDELIKRLDFAFLSEKEDSTEQQEEEETLQNEEEEDTTDKVQLEEEAVQNEEEDNTDKEQLEKTVQNEEEDTTDKVQQEEIVQNEEEDNTDKEQPETVQIEEENESVMENGVNSETQVVNENVEPDTYHTTVVADDWVKINKGDVEPEVSDDGEVQPINTTVVEEAIHKETDSTVGKIGTPEPQISNAGEALSTPVTDDVRENRETTSESVEIDEAMVDAGLVDDTSSVMGQGDVQDVGSLGFTDSTAAIMDGTDSAAVLMDATDSTAVDLVEVSVETNVTVTQSVVTEVVSSDEELQNKEADREPEVQPINTTVVEEAIHKVTDSTVGKIGTPKPQISNVGEAQSVSTPVTDDVREDRENTSKSVEIDEAMVDAGLVDDTSSVMGQGDVQDVGSLGFTDSTAAIMDATDSAAVLMDATDSTAADVVVEVSVETNVTVTQSVVTEVTQSVVTEVLSSDEELQNKEADREPEVPSHPSGDSMHSPSNQNSQVSEVSPDLGFQVRSESISTDCVSIIEKIELKDNLNANNFHIEQNVVMPEMVQPSSNDVCPDDGALRSLGGQEPCENQDSMEGLDDTSATVNLDKKNDATDALLEKLNLDRSSGDESMEEDISEGKHVESIHNSDEMEKKNSLPEVNDVNKENHVGVTIESVSDKGTSAEGMISHAVPAEKRKLQDQEVGKTNETPKRQRRWNSETLKIPELQTSTIKSGTTPKDAFPSDAPKRSVAKSGSTLSPEIARERVVPPSAKPPTTSLRIDNFLRPFTLKAVQELLAKTGAVSSFWIDHIKTHCYVTYSSVEEAKDTRNALYNLQWPTNGGKLLVADFVDPQDVKTRAEAPAPAPVSTTPKTPSSAQLSSRPPPEASPRQAVQRKQLPPPPPMTSEPPPPTKERLPLPPPPPLPQIEEPPIVTLDDLFRKTMATPRIYFLPLSEEQVAAKLARQGKNTK